MRATFKIILFSRANKGGLRPVMLRVTFLRRARYYPLHRYCLPEQWDASAGRLRKNFPDWRLENDMLRTYEQRASDALRTFERDMRRFTFDAFERMVFADRAKSAATVCGWLESVAASQEEIGKSGNAKFYREAGRVFKSFAPTTTLHDLDAHTLERFERWMRTARKFTDGGMAGIMRTIRAAYNRAEKAGMVAEGSSPFKTWSFSHLKNRKGQKAVPLEKIWALRDAECHSAGERFALDLFMFSFYMRGMNLAYIAELRPGDVRDMRLWYVRRKTGRQYTIPVSAAAGAILDRYKGGERLFPVYPPGKMTEANKLIRREAFKGSVNDTLKRLAERAGIDPKGFSFYVSRHCYANANRLAGTPPEIIRQLMGHSDFKTSEAYLSEFGDDALDRADRGVF